MTGSVDLRNSLRRSTDEEVQVAALSVADLFPARTATAVRGSLLCRDRLDLF